jgi:ABC-type multidrug transport system fused ATPase/permease subunit
VWEFGWLKKHPWTLIVAVLGLCLHLGLTLQLIPLARQLEPLLRQFELSAFVSFIALLLGIYAAKGLFDWLQQVAWSQLVLQRSMERRLELYRYLLQMPLSRWQNEQSGDLQARLTVDLQELENASLNQLSRFFPNLLQLAVLLLYLIWLNPILTLVTALLLPLGSLSLNLTSLRLRHWSERLQTARGQLFAEIAESLQALPSLWPLQVSTWLENRLNQIQKQLLRAQRKQVAWRALQGPLLGWVQALALGLVLLSGAWQVQSGRASVADLLAFGTALALSIDPVLACVEAWGLVQSALPAQKRLAELLPTQGQISSPTMMLLPQDSPNLLEIRGVDFGYPGQPALFQNLNLALPARKWTALLGPSGCGKSSLLHLLADVLPLQTGLRWMRADLQKTVLVPQKSAFLNLSLAENLCLGKDIAAEELAQVLEICQINRFLSHLPLGLASPMGNQGSLFSGGERQRIALARALLARPQLLLLDEATSELDPLTEAQLLSALKQTWPDLTCLWVSHRPDSLLEVEYFLSLAHGTISVIESTDGPHV